MLGQVLVTGADGFIGSHLVETLVRDGHKVKALTIYNSFNSWGWLDDSDVRDKITVEAGDIRDPHYCRQLLEGVDTVFHLAALIAIPYSYAAPDSYIQTNITGTTNLCRAALDQKVKRFLHTSTSEVYGTALYVPIDEKHPLQPQSPYSASKIGADAMAMSFYNAFDLPLTIVRPFNTYGPRQSARAVIPTIISQIASGVKEIKIGETKPTRDFNYVTDTAKGMIAIAKVSDTCRGETINIGTGKDISIGDTFQLIKELMGSDVGFVTDDQRIRPQQSEVYRLCADNSKLKKLTGFSPQTSLREGLTKTISWFKDPANLSRYKAHEYNV